ncbi:amino acid adenylation domain-containing protein [Streptomyces sp. NPDC088760]|uniref:non-ribosomal peptide synthetase n=1 Tax=Streptomyces sp. NPDC088760 TaxID=3365890 RepID=UPI00380E5629
MISQARHEAADGEPSVAQRSLWFLDRMAQGRPLNSLAWRIELEGALDTDALRGALETVVARHDSLRTRFPERDRRPVRLVEDRVEVPFVVEDLRTVPLAERAAELRRRCAEDVAAGFDLARGPLLRVRLLRTADATHHLLLVVHHIVFDAVSLDLLLDELDCCYAATAQGRQPDPAALPATYDQYCQEQEALLSGPGRGALAEYWRRQLADAPPLVGPPTDRPRGPEQSYASAEHMLRLDAGLSQQVREFARAERTTPFTVLLAAFQLLLARLSGQRDVVVGSTVSGRTHSRYQPLIGFFVNTVALRGRIGAGDSFRTLVRQARTTVFDAVDHQRLPFDTVVDELKPDRSLSHSPLFQVLFGMRTPVRAGGRPGGLAVRNVEQVDNGHSQYELLVAAIDEGDSFDLLVEYAPSLYDAASVIALGERYRQLLHSALAGPDAPAETLDLLGPVLTHQVLREWNDTARPVANRTLPQGFEDTAARFGAATAVECGDDRLTYEELNAAANRLARLLIARGIGPEDIVAGALPRSTDYVVAFLATVKAGAAYQPLDLTHPQERLRTVLSDSRPAAVLSLGRAHPAAPPGCPSLVLDSPEISAELAAASAADVTDAERTTPLLAAHPAYLIHTSGSTGRPKGVLVTHAGLDDLAGSHAERFGLTPESRVLQFASPAFDASVADLVMALYAGAALVLPLDEERVPGPPLCELLHRRRISHAVLPPAVLTVLDPDDALPPGCILVVAGEACPGELAGRWSAGRTMINAYGPTEATVCVTISEPLRGNEAPPLGRPTWNTQIYVLDAAGLPVPPGVTGELYIGGDQLARGYLGRPALTAAAFVPDPYGPRPGGRLYRTGDRGRYRRDGTLEYLGRNDDQVKIRGYRIEPAEVTAVLVGHPEVVSGVVVAREDSPGDRRLVAYAVPLPGSAVDPSELRAHVAAQLPAHLVPSAFVLLDALPLTANGKVDRARLPVPASTRGDADEEPVTALERLLAALWSDLLDIEVPELGRDDDFFALGGHSLSAVALAGSLQEMFDLPLTAAAVFHAPTIGRLANRLTTELGGPDAAEPAAELLLELLAMSEDEASARLTEGAELT